MAGPMKRKSKPSLRASEPTRTASPASSVESEPSPSTPSFVPPPVVLHPRIGEFAAELDAITARWRLTSPVTMADLATLKKLVHETLDPVQVELVLRTDHVMLEVRATTQTFTRRLAVHAD